MPYPYQNQQGAGFGGSNFAVQSNPSPSAFPTLGNITAASRTYQQPSAPAPPPSSFYGGINPVAGSKSINPFGIGAPDISLADPNILARLDISNLIYSPGDGGYISSDRNYSGMGRTGEQWGGDPGANKLASDYYNYIGGLPTANRGSPALMQLSGGNLGHGPSYNSVLGGLFKNANPFDQNRLKQAGFGPTYGGPYKTGGY